MINRRRESFRDVVSRTSTLNVPEPSGAQGRTLADDLQYHGLLEGVTDEPRGVVSETRRPGVRSVVIASIMEKLKTEARSDALPDEIHPDNGGTPYRPAEVLTHHGWLHQSFQRNVRGSDSPLARNLYNHPNHPDDTISVHPDGSWLRFGLAGNTVAKGRSGADLHKHLSMVKSSDVPWEPTPSELRMSRVAKTEAKVTFKSVAKKHGYEKGDEVDTKQHGRGEIWYPKSGTQNGHVFIFAQRAVHQGKSMAEPLFNNPETHLATPEALDQHLSKVAPKTEAKVEKIALADAEAHLQSLGYERNEVTNLTKEEGGPLMHNWNRGNYDVGLYHNGKHVHGYSVTPEDGDPQWFKRTSLDAFKSSVK